MGTSRKQRSKAEGSFLELVRDQLATLQQDIIDIKASLIGLKSYANIAPVVSVESWPYFGDVGMWDSWGTGQTCQYLDFSNAGVYSRIDEPGFASDGLQLQSSKDASISKDKLLAYRYVDSKADPLLPTCNADELDSKLKSLKFCKKCRQFGEDDCVCAEVFCDQCFMLAADCVCSNPSLWSRKCSACGEHVKRTSIFDMRFDDLCKDDDPQLLHCPSCDCQNFELGEFNCIQSAKTCGACKRLGYHDMAWCSHPKCSSENMFHERCLTKSANKLFCDVCIDSMSEGKELSGDDVSSSASSIAPMPLSQQADVDSNTCHWSSEKIKVWYQVTCRIMESAKDEAEFNSIADQRWRDAKPHIPREAHSIFEAGFHNMRSKIADIFQKRRG